MSLDASNLDRLTDRQRAAIVPEYFDPETLDANIHKLPPFNPDDPDSVHEALCTLQAEIEDAVARARDEEIRELEETHG